MKLPNTHRLHSLRMENDQKRLDMDELSPRFETLRDRHTNGTAPEAVSSYQLFQTPAELAQRLVDLLGDTTGKRALEPSAGLGRILHPLLASGVSEVVAVDSSPDCAQALFSQEIPNTILKQRDFLEVSPEELGAFDLVAMNPPFHMRSDIKHVLHALRFLKPGGVLSGLCMATRHREDKLKPLTDHWEEIPAGTFKSEGTNVPTILFRIKA